MPLELKHGSFISLLNVIKPTTLPHIITATFVELSSAITPAYMIPGDPKQLEILTVLSSWVESPLILRRRRLFVSEGASRGYAFVEYEPEKELCRAYEDAHHSFIDGREIIVDYKRQQLMP
ncbi:unnamed protein product [Brassica oleracea var. botrytis]